MLDELLADHPSTPERVQALGLLGEIQYNDESFREAIPLFEQALELADDRRLEVVLQRGLTFAYLNLGNFVEAAARAERMLEAAVTVGDDAVLAEGLAFTAMTNFMLGRGADWPTVARSLALEDSERMVPLEARPSLIAALLELWVGRLAEARERLLALRARTMERGDESDLTVVLFWFSWLEMLRGELDAAAELVDEGIQLATLTGSRSAGTWALAQRGLVHAWRGESAEARTTCAQASALAEQLGYPHPHLWVANARALLELSLDDPAAAWSAVEPLVEGVEAVGIAELVPLSFLPDALEALIAVGQRERADTLLAAFEARARELDRPWALATGARCRALLLAASGGLAAAAAELDRALAEHDRLDMPLELGRTLLVRGVVERRRRRRAKAKQCFERAFERFEEAGATLWAARARRELERLGLRRARPGELSQAERRVAQLIATGMTNREAAAALFVSPKTVEAHLAQVYRKLDITSRAELGSRMVDLL